MPGAPARHFAPNIEQQLHQYEGLGHLRVRARGEALTIVSGPDEEPTRHARLRRDTVHLWRLDMAATGGRWEATPFRDTADKLVAMLVEQFGWVLTQLD